MRRGPGRGRAEPRLQGAEELFRVLILREIEIGEKEGGTGHALGFFVWFFSFILFSFLLFINTG